MSINIHASAIENTSLLELHIDGQIELIELTTKINQICQQAEELHAILSIRLTDCSFDGTDLAQSIHIQDVSRWEQAVRRVERLPNIVIALVSGTLSGPAFDLLLATDYRVAMHDFRFSMPIYEGQVWPGMMIHRLVHQIGMARCRQLLVGVHNGTAQFALTIGLIDEIADNIPLTTLIASRLAPLSNKEFSLRRQLMLEAETTTFEEALGTHLAACDRELRRLCDWKPLDPREDNP